MSGKAVWGSSVSIFTLAVVLTAIVSMLASGLPLSAMVGRAAAEVPPEALSSGPGRFSSILCTDLDDDGRDEIVFGSYDGYVVAVEYASGDYFVDWTSPQFGTRVWGLTTGQFDTDPAVELIVGDGQGVVRAIDGVTKAIEWECESLGRDAHGLLLHDLDGDGANELLVGTGFKTDQGWGRIYLFNRSAREPYDEFERFDSRLRELEIVDIDRDGVDELVVTSGAALGDVAGEGYLRVFNFTDTSTPEWRSPDLGGCNEGMRVVDLDGDGRLEIVASNGYRYREGHCYVWRYENDEVGYRQVWKSPNIGPKVYGLAVGDIDDDGVIEIVVGNLAGSIYIYNGVTFEQEWRSENLGRDILGIALGDPDRDGDLEIIAAQGGYNGKGDFTSGYTPPHVYIIDGKTHAIEAILGRVDPVVQWLKIALLVAVVTALVQVSILVRWRYHRRRGKLDRGTKTKTKTKTGTGMGRAR